MMFTRNCNLEDLCLQVIVRNLDFFIFNKTIPQKHVDFLLRLYSEVLFQSYKETKKITEDCMLWFLNPHVKKVTLPRRLHSEKIIKQLQIIGPGITSLSLRGSEATENVLNTIVCSIPHVMDLNISETSCTDKTLLCIGNMCPNLVTLNLSYCDGISEDGMENLYGVYQSLRKIDCRDFEPYDVDIILNKMPTLECIKNEYSLCDLLMEIGENKQYNLRELTFDIDFSVKPSKVMEVITKMCPKLKKMHFTQPVDKTVLQACAKFQELEELKIKMSHRYNVRKIKDVLTPILPLSNNLKILILSCVEISIVTLVECFKNLTSLYLKRVSFTDFKEGDVKVVETQLDTLVIKNTEFDISSATYKGLVLLISLSKNVTKLQFSHIRKLPHDVFDIILKTMRSLTSINLKNTNVNSHCLMPLFDIPSMKTIYSNSYVDSDNLIKNTLAKKSACTLAWRQMHDSDTDDDDDEEEDGLDDDCDEDDCDDYDDDDCDDYDDDDCDDYDDDDCDDYNSDHVISDKCNSSDSDSDKWYLPWEARNDLL